MRTDICFEFVGILYIYHQLRKAERFRKCGKYRCIKHIPSFEMKVYKCYKRGKVKIKIDAETIYNNFNRQLYVTLRVIAISTLIITFSLM